ncbi:hypothetical protein ACWD9K_32820 [Streptomyces sp. 900116325]
MVDSVIGLTAGRLRTALAACGRVGTTLSIMAALTFLVLAALLLIDVIIPEKG